MNKIDYQSFCALAKMTQEELRKIVKKYLTNEYDKDSVTATKDFILCKGNIPIMLVAHLDTVFAHPPKDIYFDQIKHVIWSPQGLGADDRAGVFSIIKIVEAGWRPHILLTTDEEVGGIGAQTAVTIFPTCPVDVKYIIELDRSGSRDCVFYDCDNKSFTKYIESFGFIQEEGSFSDISVLCPTWGVAGVNLSIGYKNEHTIVETFNTEIFYKTVKAVIEMLKDVDNVEKFEFIFNKDTFHFWNHFSDSYWDSPPEDCTPNFNRESKKSLCKCWGCLKHMPEDDCLLAQSKKNKDYYHYYCIDCLGEDSIHWCDKCGDPFEDDKDVKFCYNCR